MDASWSKAARPVLIGILVAEILVLVIGAWFALSAALVVGDLSAARDELLDARDAISRSQVVEARAAMESAARHADAAASRTNGLLWDAVGAVPGVGDTADAGRAIATSLDQTLVTLLPLVDDLGAIDPDTLVSPDGRIDVSVVQEAVPALRQAQPGIDQALATLQGAPVGRWVPTPVRRAASEYLDQLTGLQSALSTALTFGEIGGQLLGDQAPQRYFVAILSPNEARGTGGFLGNYAIITSQDGKVSIDTVGSNTDLPDLKRLPASLDRQFRDHYGDAPLQRGTMNLSPHLPDTAAIWLKSWRQRTGQRLDGVIAVDVIALSRMVGASGQPIPLPEGGSIGGADLARFATQGIYEKFPRADQDTQRNAYQVAILTSALESIVRPPRPEAMAKAIGEALSTHRMVVWSGDPDVERRLLAAEVGGSLRVPDGHQVEAIVLSTSNSKLDAYLDRWLTYEVGRCVDEGGRVQSHVTFTLENAIPFGQRPPEYMVGSAPMGPTGPINSSRVQIHLPNGSEVLQADVDGEPVDYTEFRQQGRPTVVLNLELPPRETRTVDVRFSEPDSSALAEVAVQPLIRDQQTVITDMDC